MAARRGYNVTLCTGLIAIVLLLGFFAIGHGPASPLDGLRSDTASGEHLITPPPAHSPLATALAVHESTYASQYGFPDVKNERLAYVTWLSSTVMGEKSEDLDEDVYFIGTRILVWQLLHYKKTMTRGIDVVVMVTPDVSESRRQRLKKDGATIRPIEFLRGKHDEWLHPAEGRWNDIMSKLRVWGMTEYDRVLMLDGDIILQHPLDGIFNDPSSSPQPTNRSSPRPFDEPDIPSTYLLASIGEVASSDHAFPPDWQHGLKKPGYFCAGFFMLAPNAQIFEYYAALLDMPHRFDSTYMEQNLLNYAHRWTGPMPWRELAYSWNIRSVNDNDLEKGVVSMHEKWWEEPFSRSQKVKGISQSMRWQMEGYYAAQDELKALVG